MRLALFPSLLLLAAAAGCNRQAPPPPQATAGPASTPAAAPMTVSTAQAGKRVPDVPFESPDGAPARLADFKGKPLLVNLWATWCGPCIRELPTLDALARREDGRLQIVTISQDMQGRKIVDEFWKGHRFSRLKPWLDRDNALMLALKEASLPVSVLYDAEGREVWRIAGDMDWMGDKARRLLMQAGA